VFLVGSAFLVGFGGGCGARRGPDSRSAHPLRGAVIIYGTSPFDAGLPPDESRPPAPRVLVGPAPDDAVIPAELLEQARSRLLGASRSLVRSVKSPDAHGISPYRGRESQSRPGERVGLSEVR
jgi:phospholipase/carboxylesterase